MDVWLHNMANLREIQMVLLAVDVLLCAECLSNDCPYSCSTVVKCVNKSLTGIPHWIPSNITVLDLSENPFLQLQKYSFVRFINLNSLSLRHCNLNQPFELPNSLQYIDLGYNSFSLENVAASFKKEGKPRIISINLEGNKLKLDGNLSIFPRSVQYLWLNNNNMKKVEAADFEILTDLRYVNLATNGLHSVASGAFDKLKQLTNVQLNDNSITDLPKGIFKNNPQMHDIGLEKNHLRNVPDLSGITMLYRLFLPRNRIKTVRGDSFGVQKIPYISLASNEIQSFNFSGLICEILDLSNNRISSIEPGSLGENSKMYALLLQRNNISSITRTSFHGARFISELNLQSNNLQKIEKGAFRNMSIGKLLLFNNSLIEMDGVLEGMERQPHLLLLFGNPRMTYIRATDFQAMKANSQIYISCRSINAFSSPFIMKAKLICSPSNKLEITSSEKGLEGNGFHCTGRVPFKCYPCAPGYFDLAFKYYGSHGCRKCPYGAFYQDEVASIDCKKCPLGQYVPPDKGPGKSPLDCLTCPKGTNTNASAGYRACYCLPGYSRKYRFGACEKCTLNGFQCKRDYPELRMGYWMNWDKIELCRNAFTSFMANLDTEDDSYNRDASYFKCNLPIAHKCPISNSCKGGVDATCNKG